jgi:hypothetical protein
MGIVLPRSHRRDIAAVVLLTALVAAALVWFAVTTTRDGPPRAATTLVAPSPTAVLEPAAPVPQHLRRWLVPGAPLPAPRAGVDVQDRVDDPVDGLSSVALSLESHQARRWVLSVVRDDGELVTYSDVPTQSRWLTFDHWLEDLVLQEEGAPGLVLASLGADGTMVPVADGARVLDQAVDRDHRMGAFREERDSVFAVALVGWERRRWFVMSERHDDEVRSVAIAASRSGTAATTAKEFITQYSELGKRP